MRRRWKITGAELERLLVLSEECAEVAQAASKILRFGYDDAHPDAPDVGNRVRLREEIIDLMWIINEMAMCEDVDVILPEDLHAAGERKRKYMQVQTDKRNPNRALYSAEPRPVVGETPSADWSVHA